MPGRRTRAILTAVVGGVVCAAGIAACGSMSDGQTYSPEPVPSASPFELTGNTSVQQFYVTNLQGNRVLCVTNLAAGGVDCDWDHTE